MTSGLDGSAIEFIGTLDRDSEDPYFGPKVLRVYTDLSYLKIGATPTEYAVLTRLMPILHERGEIIQTDDSGLFQKIMHQRADEAMRRSESRHRIFQYAS